MARGSLKNVIRLLDEVQETLPPEQSFLQDLKRSIEITDAKDSRKPSQTYKPSSMHCIRNMYYQRAGIEPDKRDPSYVLVGICNSGSDIHVRVQTAVAGMKSNGMECEYVDVANFIKQRKVDGVEIVSQQGMETKLAHSKYHLSFMCDGIIKYKNKYYILELKTETVNKWFSRQGVDPDHMIQGTAYSVALGLDNVIFVYISRDTLDMKAFMFTPTSDQKNALVGKITDCDGYVERHIAPPKPADVSKKACTYCNYKMECKKDG